jgi:hypothetical protein
MFIILNWKEFTDINIVTGEGGAPALFPSSDEALIHGKVNLDFYWKVVDLKGKSYGARKPKE